MIEQICQVYDTYPTLEAKATEYDKYHYDQESKEGVFNYQYVGRLQKQSDELLEQSKKHSLLEQENRRLKERLGKAREITHSNTINFKTWNQLKQILVSVEGKS